MTEDEKIAGEQTHSLTPEEVFIQLGLILFELHSFERVLRASVAVLNQAGRRAVDPISDFVRMNRATCGALARELRKCVNIEPEFDRILSRFTRRRNVFAHKLSLHSSFNPTAGDNWLKNVPRFLDRLRRDMRYVQGVFMRYLLAWAPNVKDELGDLFSDEMTRMYGERFNPFLGFKCQTPPKNKKQ